MNDLPKRTYRQFMSANEFKRARATLGVSQTEMAKLLGVSTSRTIRMWENEEREISGPAVVLVRWLAYGVRPALDG